jgi:putative ABC transport system substrate-binding protein
LELLHELPPGASELGLLVNPANANAEPDAKDAQAAAAAFGLELRVLKASTERELATAFDTIVEQRLGALLVGVDNILFRDRRGLIAALASRHAVPAIYERREFAVAGGLMSYGADGADNARQQGLYIARILKGAKPADLPVLQASKFEFVINLNAAKALKLDVPTSILLRANELIE